MSNQQRHPAASSNPRQRSKPKLRNQLLFVVGLMLLAGGTFYAALIVASRIDQIFFPGNEISLGLNLPGVDNADADDEIGGSRINILVLGLDKRPSDGDSPSRTDTMFVMTVDPSTGTSRGLGIPRDLYVDIPGKTGTFKERINAAYVYGEQQNYPGGGVALAEKTVEDLLDLDIDYHVMIDFEGFKQVIDMLGGIDVEVTTPINDPYYSETELLNDFFPCIFDTGIHHMNGSEALCYARTRRDSSDLDRIIRQQHIIFAVIDKATQLDILSDPTNVVSLWKSYKNTVTTNINDLQIPGFARLASSIDINQTAFLSLGAATTPYTTAQGAAVLLPSEEGVKQLVDAFLADNQLVKEAAIVEVQNGTGIEGQAQKAIDYFTGLGIPKASLIALNASRADYVTTEIISYSGKTYTAERIADWLSLPSNTVRLATAEDQALRNSADADVVVILGSDAQFENALAP